MSGEPRISRRELAQAALALAALGALPLAGCDESGTVVRDRFFSPDEESALGALANAILPPDDRPGGAALGAVEYINRLLVALEVENGKAPDLYAGGPYSGRTPFADDGGKPSANFPANAFANRVPLDRVRLAAWKLKLYGSSGVSGGGPNDAVLGVVIGLRDMFRTNLTAAMQSSPEPLPQLSPEDLESAFFGLDPDFRDVLVALVTQAAFAAPEYGGNPKLAGWNMVHFEGDSQPLGYSQFDSTTQSYVERPDAPMSGPSTASDPEPMDSETRAFIQSVVDATGGKTFGS